MVWALRGKAQVLLPAFVSVPLLHTDLRHSRVRSRLITSGLANRRPWGVRLRETGQTCMHNWKTTQNTRPERSRICHTSWTWLYTLVTSFSTTISYVLHPISRNCVRTLTTLGARRVGLSVLFSAGFLAIHRGPYTEGQHRKCFWNKWSWLQLIFEERINLEKTENIHLRYFRWFRLLNVKIMKFYNWMGIINASYIIPDFVFITEKLNNQNLSPSKCLPRHENKLSDFIVLLFPTNCLGYLLNTIHY